MKSLITAIFIIASSLIILSFTTPPSDFPMKSADKEYFSHPDADSILKEGMLLYRLERAAWLAGDHITRNFPGKTKEGSIYGYFAYENTNGNIVTVHYNFLPEFSVVLRYIFDSMPAQDNIRVLDAYPQLTDFEYDIFQINIIARGMMLENGDGFFDMYEELKLGFNTLPIKETDGGYRVYFLSATSAQVPFVLLGNDYLLRFDKNMKLISRQKLHEEIMPIEYDPRRRDVQNCGHYHTTPDIIYATDICTLLLYKDITGWEEHLVASPAFFTRFDMTNLILYVDDISSEDYEVIFLENDVKEEFPLIEGYE